MPTRSPLRVDERAAGVAEIDGGIGLDEILEGREPSWPRPVALTMPCVTVWLRP
jgi:hypothetical protein